MPLSGSPGETGGRRGLRSDRGETEEKHMTRNIRKAALAAFAFAGGLGLASPSAQAQGPYGGNTYADFPFNQGSLFYQPVKPKVTRRSYYVAPRRPATYAAPVQGRTLYQAPPGWYQTSQGPRYYPQGYTYYR